MRRFAVLAVLLPLLGCNTPDAAQAPLCPSVGVLLQASSVTRLRPGASDPSGALLTANMSQAALACDYDAEDRRVVANIDIPITVTRGPAGAGVGPQALDYFVSVVDVDGTILSKRNFQRVVDLGNRDSFTITERVTGTTLTIPMGRTPPQYQVIAGFQLTPAEVAYNQRPRAPQQP
jgi:hypothetical protein